jgi:hypothetical protein
MKRNLSIAALLLVAVPAFSQLRQSEVVASAGGFDEKSGISVSYTIGEAVTGTLAKGDVILVQGFQQGYAAQITPPSSVVDELAISADIYPNPVNSVLYVTLGAEPEGESLVRCFDMTGRMVGESYFEGDRRLSMNVDALPQGAYFVKVFVDGRPVVNRKIMKY